MAKPYLVLEAELCFLPFHIRELNGCRPTVSLRAFRFLQGWWRQDQFARPQPNAHNASTTHIQVTRLGVERVDKTVAVRGEPVASRE